MGELLRLHMYHRARKVPVAEKEKKKKKDETDEEEEKETKKSKKDDKKASPKQSNLHIIITHQQFFRTRRRKRKKRRRSERSDWRCTMTKFSWMAMTLTCGSMTRHHGNFDNVMLVEYSDSPLVIFAGITTSPELR